MLCVTLSLKNNWVFHKNNWVNTTKSSLSVSLYLKIFVQISESKTKTYYCHQCLQTTVLIFRPLMVFTKWYICISSSLAILLKYNVLNGYCHDDYGIRSFANVSVFNKHLVQLYCIVSVWNAFSVLFLFWNVMRMIYYYLIVLLQEFERKQICFRIYVDPMIIH